MRYQIMCNKQNADSHEFTCFFETDDFDEAKSFAMHLCFVDNYLTYVFDTKLQERIMDYEDKKYRA